MKVLHVAPLNVAGVPYNMMDMQRRFGTDARLVTLHRSTLTFPEDICLDLPLLRNQLATWWRRRKSQSARSVEISLSDLRARLPVHSPKNLLEALYFRFDDLRRTQVVRRAFDQFRFDEFDIIHYDGGSDFFRDSRIAKRWHREGKKIICHYMGSDLRLRGIISEIDRIADLNLTNESDHLLRHPNIHYIFIPFDVTSFTVRRAENPRLRIVHAPTNRAMKGTELILPVIEELKKHREIEFVLLENKPHDEVLRIKQTCDLAIEQVGNLGGTGYGRNSLETLALGIPTITEMTKDYVAWLPENPFVLATPQTLLERLIELVDDPRIRAEKAKVGRKWVEKYHSYEAVHNRLMDLYREHHII